MAIEYKDYYETLGVTRDASEEEVRNAFRKLARVFHPDKTGNDPNAERRFKEINEAYEVLGDPGKRQRYDDFVGAWETNGSWPGSVQDFLRTEEGPNFARRGGHEHYRFDGAGFSEFFEQMFGRRAAAGSGRTEAGGHKSPTREAKRATNAADLRGDDLESDIWVTLEEVASGAVRAISMKRAVKCPNCLGMAQINAQPCSHCEGNGSLVQTDTYKVKIPQGIKDGAFLRVPGRGEPGVTEPGDLYLKVHYTAHPEFRMEHGALVHELEVAPWEAVLGASISVPTLQGAATIKIPPGTQSGRKLRLKGRGLPSADGTAGDLILEVRVQVPSSARSRERELWEELARESQFVPRHN